MANRTPIRRHRVPRICNVKAGKFLGMGKQVRDAISDQEVPKILTIRQRGFPVVVYKWYGSRDLPKQT